MLFFCIDSCTHDVSYTHFALSALPEVAFCFFLSILFLELTAGPYSQSIVIDTPLQAAQLSLKFRRY